MSSTTKDTRMGIDDPTAQKAPTPEQWMFVRTAPERQLPGADRRRRGRHRAHRSRDGELHLRERVRGRGSVASRIGDRRAGAGRSIDQAQSIGGEADAVLEAVLTGFGA